MRLKLKDC